MKTKSAVKERSIRLTGSEVRAILEGRKTQTRRIMKHQPETDIVGATDAGWWYAKGQVWLDRSTVARFECPYGKPGDRLWVREAWGVAAIYDKTKPSDICQDIRRDPNWPLNKAPCGVRYPANMDCVGVRIRPSIHMPRWASRITLEITDVRVQRLNDISEGDAIAEGCFEFASSGLFGHDKKGTPCTMVGASAVEAYYHLWESINGNGSWSANPWVWVIEFKKVDA